MSHDHWQHHRRHGDVVHEGRHCTADQHNHHYQPTLALTSQTQHLAADQIRHPGPGQPPAENKHRPDSNHGRVAEA